MAANNTAPIYTGIPDIQWIDAVATANTTRDLTSGTSYLAFTADATNGGYLNKLRFAPKGTNIQTVARIWINNGSTTGTAANNLLYQEVTLIASTSSETAALAFTEVPLDIALPAGYRIYITVGTTVSAGFMVGVIAGKYTQSS